jgi:hypothetical protein
MKEFDYAAYAALITDGVSQREAFARLGVKRSTGQDALKRRQSVAVEVLPRRPPGPQGPLQPSRALPVPTAGELEAMRTDLRELVDWWRGRKLRQAQPRQVRETISWTVHLDPTWKARVEELADAERRRLTDVVDEIFRTYFEGIA